MRNFRQNNIELAVKKSPVNRTTAVYCDIAFSESTAKDIYHKLCFVSFLMATSYLEYLSAEILPLHYEIDLISKSYHNCDGWDSYDIRHCTLGHFCFVLLRWVLQPGSYLGGYGAMPLPFGQKSKKIHNEARFNNIFWDFRGVRPRQWPIQN